MSGHPCLSIIMPVYGVEKYIEKSVQSVINQTYKNFELILVDDGSKDNSIQIAEHLLSSTSIDYYIYHKENGGLGDSRNYGFDYSTGEWVLFLDSDDILQPSSLQDMVNALEVEPKANFVFSLFQLVNIGEEFKSVQSNGGVELLSRSDIEESFLRRDKVILAPGTLINRDWLKQNNILFKKVPYSEDQLFIWEMLLSSDKALFVKKELYNYLQRPNSIMTGTKYNKILQAYPYFLELNEYVQGSENALPSVKKYFLSRWVLGVLNSSSKLCVLDDYRKICHEFEARKHMRNLLSFPSLKTRLAALLFLLSPSMYYKTIKNK